MSNTQELKKLQSKNGLTLQSVQEQEISNMSKCYEAVNGKIPLTHEIQIQIDLLDDEYIRKHGMRFVEYINLCRARINADY